MPHHSSNSIEAQVRRVLWIRRLSGALILLILVAALGYAGYFFWNATRVTHFELPSYAQFDETEPDYWSKRVLWDIETTQDSELSDRDKDARLLFLITGELAATKKLPANYERTMAVYEIASTLTQKNVDINIDDTVRSLEETDLAWSIRARIYISQALMQLRLKNLSAARVSLLEYNRILVASDLKLDSKVNEESFQGAVTVLACLSDTTGLTDLFQKNIDYTDRADPSHRMKAYRTIAAEQARVGFARDAVQTLRYISNSVELSRACQLIIFFTARPITLEPEEPKTILPATQGPWPELPNPTVTENIIDEIFRYLTSLKSSEDRQDVLSQIASSRLMCDPPVHALFTKKLEQANELEENVRQSVLHLLNEPESDTIRTALGMDPLPERVKVSDPALDDWESPLGSLSVDVANIDSELMRALMGQQLVRTYLSMAQSYLSAGRRTEATSILTKADQLAQLQSVPIHRTRLLLSVAERQLHAGAVGQARKTLQRIGLPGELINAEMVEVYSEDRLSDMARLQIVGRFFDDALATVKHLTTESRRDDQYAFLAAELVRIGYWDLAKEIVGRISPGRARDELRHTLAIATSAGPVPDEHFAALRIPNPETLTQDEQRIRCFNLLLRKGLFDTAAKLAEKVENNEKRTQLQTRLVREIMLLFAAYGDSDPAQEEVREKMLHRAVEIADQIELPQQRVIVFESILSAALSQKKDPEIRKKIDAILDPLWDLCANLQPDIAEKTELFAKLVLILSELTDMKQKDQAENLKRRIEQAVQFVNDSPENQHQAWALSRLAKAALRSGRFQVAKRMIEAARTTADELQQNSDTSDLYLSLVPTLKALGEDEKAQQLCMKTYISATNRFADTETETDGQNALMLWRSRDMEIDRIVQVMIEQDFMNDAIECTSKINEGIIRDRLFKIIAYIYLNRNDFVRSESVAKRIELDTVREPILRDILILRRLGQGI